MNSLKISAFAFVVVCLAFTQALEVQLQTAGGELVRSDITIANVSGVVGGALDSVNLEEEQEIIIPFPTVTAKTMHHVLHWAQYHLGDRDIPEDKRTNEIDAWSKDFLENLKQDEVFDVILAANMMDVRGLLDVSTQHVANWMKGKTPEQLRTLFGITE